MRRKQVGSVLKKRDRELQLWVGGYGADASIQIE